LTKCCPKFLERERMQNGVHAAPGRQVSTWVHAVKAEEVSRVGGSLSHSVILRLSSLGSGASEPFFLCVCLCIPTHSEGNPHGKVVHCPFSHPPSEPSENPWTEPRLL
jgi:hypothetical protein